MLHIGHLSGTATGGRGLAGKLSASAAVMLALQTGGTHPHLCVPLGRQGGGGSEK